MAKKKLNFTGIVYYICIFSITYLPPTCNLIFHDNTPPTGLDQWLAKKVKSKYHD